MMLSSIREKRKKSKLKRTPTNPKVKSKIQDQDKRSKGNLYGAILAKQFQLSIRMLRDIQTPEKIDHFFKIASQMAKQNLIGLSLAICSTLSPKDRSPSFVHSIA